MDISSLLQGAMGQQLLQGVMGQTGLNQNQASSAINAAIPMILSGLNHNVQNGGAEGLMNALNKDHNGSILDNLGGFFNQGNFSDGAGILKHVLGGKQEAASNALGKQTGIDGGQMMKILIMVAPIVMGYLGRQKAAQNVNAGGLGGLLGSVLGGATQQNQGAMGAIQQILLGGGGGNSPLGGLGDALLGGLLGGKK